MKKDDRLTTHRPLADLWRGLRDQTTRRVRDLGRAELERLIARGPVQLVVADRSLTLEWVPPERASEFWTSELAPRLIEPGAPIRPDMLPGGYGYSASQWEATSENSGLAVVLLEKRH